jgi:MFS family permease
VSWGAYRELLRLPGIPRLLAIGLIARLPHAASGVIFSMHVVYTLDRDFFDAGVLTTFLAVGYAIGMPWRGRVVDRKGLRRALAPSVVIEAACWLACPFLGFVALIPLCFVMGVYGVPVFSVIRQAMTATTPRSTHHTGLALDAVMAELAFVIGPMAGATCATGFGSRPTLIGLGVATVGSGLALLIANPPVRAEAEQVADADPAGKAKRSGLFRLLWPVLLANLAIAICLTACDLGVVASLKSWDQAKWTGLLFALWSVGSMVGGLVFGGQRRQPSPQVMVLLLAGLSAPLALATGALWLAILVTVAGLACAPALASVNAKIAQLVPSSRRGVAYGLGGTASTIGSSLGAPLVGAFIDQFGPASAYWSGAGLACLVGVVAWVAAHRAPPAKLWPTKTAHTGQGESGA